MPFAFAVNYFPIQQANFHMTDTVIGKTSRLFLLNMKHLQTTSKHWIDTENRLNQKQTIDSEFQRCILAEEMHWLGVLERLLAIVQFLAQNNMAFRGTEERLNAPNNGNFLGLVQLRPRSTRARSTDQ